MHREAHYLRYLMRYFALTTNIKIKQRTLLSEGSNRQNNAKVRALPSLKVRVSLREDVSDALTITKMDKYTI